jgi:hypothetical protein
MLDDDILIRLVAPAAAVELWEVLVRGARRSIAHSRALAIREAATIAALEHRDVFIQVAGEPEPRLLERHRS